MKKIFEYIHADDLERITGGGGEVSGSITLHPPMGSLVFTQETPVRRLETSVSTNGRDWETKVQVTRDSGRTRVSLGGWIGRQDRNLNGGLVFSMKW